ncbi:uncharacterized protein ANIA_11532 [Aspergillus nidulans FGSC A4]|uniref:Uncharacterized protein n=1 Tax=Emericella nidulans (strain FGSC A4 / ATCC 38163 / CBS 112.46 / NRRL 194 / M139) TaxID=227321 RepID=C8V2Q6_EMENI|nr:hypothetical protein [Aspergillus nidulans FGSC A4]CBF71648.1 TPA: hypothetical protein ANIA_11532 [Aspergillus nidulans FGSC A4]
MATQTLNVHPIDQNPKHFQPWHCPSSVVCAEVLNAPDDGDYYWDEGEDATVPEADKSGGQMGELGVVSGEWRREKEEA